MTGGEFDMYVLAMMREAVDRLPEDERDEIERSFAECRARVSFEEDNHEYITLLVNGRALLQLHKLMFSPSRTSPETN